MDVAQVPTNLFLYFRPAPAHTLHIISEKPICGLDEKWLKMHICWFFDSGSEMVHALCPNFFLQSQVTQYTTFREFFFQLILRKKNFALENFENLG